MSKLKVTDYSVSDPSDGGVMEEAVNSVQTAAPLEAVNGCSCRCLTPVFHKGMEKSQPGIWIESLA